jgi:hypothetical protein
MRTGLIALVTTLALALPAQAQGTNFEDVPGATLNCGGVLATGDVLLLGENFFGGGGFVGCFGAQVQPGFNGTQVLQYNNITARFLFPCCPQEVVLDYRDFGGTNNVRINGDLQIVPDMLVLNGAVLGLFGGQVQVTVGGGQMRFKALDGCILDFAIGGQELQIDNVFYRCDPCDNSTPRSSTSKSR